MDSSNMADGHIQAVNRRRRNCSSRVRTGCITCKIRRVKCDETKPACNRCTSTGRTCDGYSLLPQSQLRKAVQPTESPTEARAIAYFFRRVSPFISGFFESDTFWKTIALRTSHDAPAVKHALLAVSALYEAVERKGRVDYPVELDDGFAVLEYNKAIRCLVEHKDHDPGKHATVSLVTCVLFVCLELMRGNIAAAQKHIRSGSAILDAELLRPGDTTPSKHIFETDIMEELSSTFSRMRLQSVLFDSDGIPKLIGHFSHIDPCLHNFTTISEARHAQYILSANATNFIVSTFEAKYSLNATLSQLVTQAHIQSQLQQWRHSFNSFFSIHSSNWTAREVKAAKVLRIHNLVMWLWLSTCLTPEECVFDAYYAEFESIINLASEIIEENKLTTASLFHFDMGVIPPLHFVGSKCRFPNLRRRILQLLGSSHWKEGMFDSHRSYRFVHLCLEIEESELAVSKSGIVLGNDDSSVGQDSSEGLPPERARLHFAELGPIGPNSVRQRLTLVAKPTGLFEEPVMWETWIPTSGPLSAVRPWVPRKSSMKDYPAEDSL